MLLELIRILVGQKEECPAGEAVADAVQGRSHLAGGGDGAGGAGAVVARSFGLGGRGRHRHITGSGGWAEQLMAQGVPAVKEFTLILECPNRPRSQAGAWNSAD